MGKKRYSAMMAALLICTAAPSLWAKGKPPPPPAPSPAEGEPGALPADLNHASLRVTALDTMYELDLSVDQVKTLRSAAVKTAANPKRTAVKPNPDLAKGFKDLQDAILARKDGDEIARLRNQVIKLAGEVELDDEVQPTEAALAAAPAICGKLKASQIAAYMALHADQVADPAEMLADSVETARDLRENAGPKADAETDAFIAETAAAVGYLVHGADNAKAKSLEKDAQAWLKTNSELDDKQDAEKEKGREDEARKIVGKTDPIKVLGHWMDSQMAQLLSNPELPAAIDADLLARGDAK